MTYELLSKRIIGQGVYYAAIIFMLSLVVSISDLRKDAILKKQI